MDRDLTLRFIEDKEREVEELHYQLGLVHLSPRTKETPSDLAAMVQVGMSVMHDEREEPLVTGLDEEHSELPVLGESCDSESLDCTLSWYRGDRELFPSESTPEAQEIVEHLPCGPAHEEVCVH
jgi:hypothetical protein